MSKESISLLVRTDSYTGNTDTFILAALFGINDGRYGGGIGEPLWEEHFKEEEDVSDSFMDVVTCENTEYGRKEYQINNDLKDGYNTLEIFIDNYAEERLKKLFPLWKKAYGNAEDDTLSLTYGGKKVKILGFSLKRYHNTYSIEVIE